MVPVADAALIFDVATTVQYLESVSRHAQSLHNIIYVFIRSLQSKYALIAPFQTSPKCPSLFFCRLRVPSTMTFKFSDNLALAQNMPVTVSNVPFGMREMSYGERPIHVPLWVGVVFGQLVRFPLSLHTDELRGVWR